MESDSGRAGSGHSLFQRGVSLGATDPGVDLWVELRMINEIALERRQCSRLEFVMESFNSYSKRLE